MRGCSSASNPYRLRALEGISAESRAPMRMTPLNGCRTSPESQDIKPTSTAKIIASPSLVHCVSSLTSGWRCATDASKEQGDSRSVCFVVGSCAPTNLTIGAPEPARVVCGSAPFGGQCGTSALWQLALSTAAFSSTDALLAARNWFGSAPLSRNVAAGLTCGSQRAKLQTLTWWR